VSTLILLRHGQSVWNLEARFTGWTDVGLTDRGIVEAIRAGRAMAEAGVLPDICHTSVLARSIRTAELALEACGRQWLPVRRHWRLNERHYGALQGHTHAEMAAIHGADQVQTWRRSYDVRPPALSIDDERHPIHDPRYARLHPDALPAAECLADVVSRMLPYFHDVIAEDLSHGIVLVVAHGNSLRALVKYLEGISDQEIPKLEIATGVPLVYELDESYRVKAKRALDITSEGQ
jgi:2,3-bisphosphoglycerate-dependent phosphoglycerate mutase